MASDRGRGQTHAPNQSKLPATSRTIFSQGLLAFRGRGLGRPSPATCERERPQPGHRGADVLRHHDSWWREGTGILSGTSSSPRRGTCCPSDEYHLHDKEGPCWARMAWAQAELRRAPGAALTRATQVSFTFWFSSWATSHPDARKYPLNAKREKSSKTFLVVFLFF